MPVFCFSFQSKSALIRNDYIFELSYETMTSKFSVKYTSCEMFAVRQRRNTNICKQNVPNVQVENLLQIESTERRHTFTGKNQHIKHMRMFSEHHPSVGSNPFLLLWLLITVIQPQCKTAGLREMISLILLQFLQKWASLQAYHQENVLPFNCH